VLKPAFEGHSIEGVITLGSPIISTPTDLLELSAKNTPLHLNKSVRAIVFMPHSDNPQPQILFHLSRICCPLQQSSNLYNSLFPLIFT
jgi:hypothetical protein